MPRFILPLLALLLVTFAPQLVAAVDPQPTATTDVVTHSDLDLLDRPLIERYILDELKHLRSEQQDLERRMTVDITDRELAVADKSLNYANVTVTYFFYIIAGVASLIAFIGWQSLREIKTNTAKLAAEQLQKITEQYENKFKDLERDLKRKSHIITKNNREIEIINEIHTLWLHAQSAQTPEQKISVYNEILSIRPGDLEAVTYKADAAMEMREFNWALSLCNRVLEVDGANAHALYQRACAFACLRQEDRALSDLEQAIENSASFKEVAANEADFANLRDNPKFDVLISSSES
ncbi:tetratricopeptide repeat protein [Shewanella colwelliana]|uniref:tetratricopeptide repeat protein n=1 Tax=Shewanella colwelliana TaxID=23 RepID=UPI003D0877AF